MSWWSPIVLSKQINSLRNISNTHVTIDDWLQRREPFHAGVDSSGAVRAQQNRVLDHQASIFNRCSGRVADETLMLDEIASREAGNFTDILDVFDAGVL